MAGSDPTYGSVGIDRNSIGNNSPAADALAPRDREVLALVATSPFGVDRDAVGRLLRRLGLTARAAYACLEGLTASGLLSIHDDRADLPAEDLAWIRTHTL